MRDNTQNFYQWLVGYLDGCDLIDLIVGSGAPCREYEPEAKAIFRALPTIAAWDDAPRVIHEVFLSKFANDLKIVGELERYREIGYTIYQAWHQHDEPIFSDRNLGEISERA